MIPTEVQVLQKPENAKIIAPYILYFSQVRMWLYDNLTILKQTIIVNRDMHAAVCGGRAGLCDVMRPPSGADLLKYLRNVTFTGITILLA